jgi:hypothetical protein
MTSEERHKARYHRRKAAREAKLKEKIERFDNFSQVTAVDNLYAAFKASKRGVSWKESVQRYEANAMRSIAETSRKLMKIYNMALLSLSFMNAVKSDI